MTSERRPAPAERLPHADECIAVLRIGVGIYFAKALFTKLTITSVGLISFPVTSSRWTAALPHLVAKQAAGNPVLWYRVFLEQTVLPHAAMFADLTAWGEVVVGVLLVTGWLTWLGAGLGAWLVVNYGLATQWMAPSQLMMHLLLLSLMILFVVTRAGRRWGIDAVLAGRMRAHRSSPPPPA